MPDGSSSAAPVIRPGPRTRRNRWKIFSFLFAVFFFRPPPPPLPVDPFTSLFRALFFHETFRAFGTVSANRLKFLAVHFVIRNEELLNFAEQVRIDVSKRLDCGMSARAGCDSD